MSPWRREERAWITNVLLIVIGMGLILFTRQLVIEFDHFTIGFSQVSGYSALLYIAAVALVLTQPLNRYTFVIILAVAIGCRVITLLPDPYLSSDIYRYAWDGVVQHAHISPYRYVPGAKELTFLRAPNQELFDNMNRRDYAVTIYPPVAQMIFYVVTFFTPVMTGMKLAMILFEGVTMWAIVALLKELGYRKEQSLIYAWCPLLIWEIGSSGHIDSAAMAFIALALLARYRQNWFLTGLFLGLATMTKMYPLALFPALYRRGEWKMPSALVAVIVVGYACYASVGMRVFGFFGGYVKEEGIGDGTRYFPLEAAQHLPGLHALSKTPYLVLIAIVIVALCYWCWSTCCRPDHSATSSSQTSLFGLPPQADFLPPATVIATVLMLLFSPHYPWYLAWLVPFATLIPEATVLTYTCMLFYLCTTALAVGYGPKQFLLNEILYFAVLGAVFVDCLLARWKLHPRILSRSREVRS